MDYETRIRQTGHCGLCNGSLKDSQYINALSVKLEPRWKYPRVGDLRLGTPPESVTFVCDTCIQQRLNEPEEARPVRHVVEFVAAPTVPSGSIPEGRTGSLIEHPIVFRNQQYAIVEPADAPNPTPCNR